MGGKRHSIPSWGKGVGEREGICKELLQKMSRERGLNTLPRSLVIRFEGAVADYRDATIAVATAESMVPTTVVKASSMVGLFAAPRTAQRAGA